MVAGFAILALFLVWPLVTTFAYSFRGPDGSYGLSGYAAFFNSRPYRDSLWNTLILGGAVTATSMVVGGALAILVARCRFAFAGWVAALPLVTLVIPDVVVAAAWTLILGQQGIVNSWISSTGLQVGSLSSWWGLVFVMTLMGVSAINSLDDSVQSELATLRERTVATHGITAAAVRAV